jgi:hypothetical protein
MAVGGKLPVAHDKAAERAVLGGERVVLDFAVVEGALLRHHQWGIRRCAEAEDADHPRSDLLGGAARDDLVGAERNAGDFRQIERLSAEIGDVVRHFRGHHLLRIEHDMVHQHARDTHGLGAAGAAGDPL